MSDEKAHEYTWSTGSDPDAIAADNDRQAIYRVGGLRDYFAAAALTGLAATLDPYAGATDIACASYNIADAMLAARKAKP